MTLDNDLSLNLCVMLTICHIVVILDSQEEVRREFLVGGVSHPVSTTSIPTYR